MKDIGLSEPARKVWAKHQRSTDLSLPLWRHLDDSAAVAEWLWDHWLPAPVRQAIARCLPGGEDDARALFIWLAGVHDVGKATPAFAVQVPTLAEVMHHKGLLIDHDLRRHPDRRLAPHATAGQILLEDWLSEEHGWKRQEQGRQFAVVVGGHHGVPPEEGDLLTARANKTLLGYASGQEPWRAVQREYLRRAARKHGVDQRLAAWRDVRLSQVAQVLLTGAVIVADWIASDEERFPYDPPGLLDPDRATRALDDLDLPTPWEAVQAVMSPAELFAARFVLPSGAVIRDVQRTAVELAQALPDPGLLIIEAPMGEGKTEAALAAAEVLAARSGAGGCFIALPTRATSDAMFLRVLSWLERVPDRDRERGAYAVMLAHGKARMNEDFTALLRGRSVSIAPDSPDASSHELASHHWLRGRKKGLLSSFVVGTIDQLLFAALKAKHVALRHLGLAGKVVVIDEAHAYDVYMSEYLDRALEWLGAYQVPVVVLSATLPAQRRKEMIQAYDRGRYGRPRPRRRPPVRRPDGEGETVKAPDPYAALDGDIGYPVLVGCGATQSPAVRVAEPSGRTVTVTLERLDDDPAHLISVLRTAMAEGGCALVIRNTVRRVQETARSLADAFGRDRVTVAHSRFLAPDRMAKDQYLRDHFGPPPTDESVPDPRPDFEIVVASQVAEQSLDIDFDVLITDLAPADLVLQRMGRLHRHPRGSQQDGRPPRLRRAQCYLTGVDWTTTPPQPVSGSIRVYDHHTLLRSLAVLTPYLNRGAPIRLPDDIAPLVQAAYGQEPPPATPEWQEAMQEAAEAFREQQTKKRRQADDFRLPAPAGDEPLVGWLYAHAGTVDDETTRDQKRGRTQVRDTPAESLEVILAIQRADGSLITPPWLPKNGGREVPLHTAPPNDLAKTLATCTLALPYQLCVLEAIEELEKRLDLEAWQQNPWLEGQLVLPMDERCNARLHKHVLHYDPWLGLEVTNQSVDP